MAKYSIEARSIRIPPLYIVSHNYWILREAGTKGRDGIIAELHGLAYDSVRKRYLPVGHNEKTHRLHGLHSVHNYRYYSELPKELVTFGPNRGYSLYKDRQRSEIVLTGGDEVKERWLKAVKAAKFLTEKNLHYPWLGIKGEPEALLNGNSVYRTLGEVMGVKVVNFRWTAEPGLRNSFLTREEMEKMRYPVPANPQRCERTPFLKPGEVFHPPEFLRRQSSKQPPTQSPKQSPAQSPQSPLQSPLQSPVQPLQSPAPPARSPMQTTPGRDGAAADRLPTAYEVAERVHKSMARQVREQRQQQRETEQSFT